MFYCGINMIQSIKKGRRFMFIKNEKQLFKVLFLLAPLSLNTFSKSETKEAVFVIGAPRSGTSCIAGVLEILGVDYGNHLFKADEFNEKGYFEDELLHLISREMFAELGISTLYPRIIDWSQESKKEEFKMMARTTLQKFRGKSFGIKYPDASFVLPVYIESMIELGYTPKLVIVLRNPDEIVESWLKRWGIPAHETYAVISKIYLNIIRDTHGYDTLVIYYDDMLNDTEKVVNRMTHFISGLKSYDEAKAELNNFIDGSLKHHTVSA
jgi:hypothetical protein